MVDAIEVLSRLQRLRDCLPAARLQVFNPTVTRTGEPYNYALQFA
jgi:hypothetical protein